MIEDSGLFAAFTRQNLPDAELSRLRGQFDLAEGESLVPVLTVDAAGTPIVFDDVDMDMAAYALGGPPLSAHEFATRRGVVFTGLRIEYASTAHHRLILSGRTRWTV